MSNLTAGVIIIGSEILSGRTLDTNANFIAKKLVNIGIQLEQIRTIHDEQNNIINTVKELLGIKPIFGICLGHQILSLALGAKTFKLKFGHRGCNHPVKNLKTDIIEITSQNHGFAVSDNNLPSNIEITHLSLNDNTIEGIRCKELNAFSVQHHPEASPGPHDSRYLFEDFIKSIKAEKAHA